MSRVRALIERAGSRRASGRNAPGANPNHPPLPLLRPFSYSVLGHVVVVAFMLIGLAGRTQSYEPAFGTIAIDGVVLDDEAVQREIQRLDDLERAAVIQREQEVERLRKRIEDQQEKQERQERELSALNTQTDQARRTLNQQQTQASRELGEMQKRQQQERERLQRIERERQQEEKRAQAAAAERDKAERETRQLSAEAKEARRQLEETARKKRQAEVAEQVRKELEQERRRQAVESGLLDEYKARIRQRIESYWVQPPGSREDLMWVVLLDVLPGNEVAAIRFEQFNGTEIDRRSIEVAIRRSSPLPAPPEPELFARQLRLRYPPPESG